MFYEYVELSDGTQIAYSNVLEDDAVEVIMNYINCTSKTR